MRPMTPLLTLLLFAAQDPEAPTLQDLMAPEAAVVKRVGGMKFTEGPVWLPKEQKLVFSDVSSSSGDR